VEDTLLLAALRPGLRHRRIYDFAKPQVRRALIVNLRLRNPTWSVCGTAPSRDLPLTQTFAKPQVRRGLRFFTSLRRVTGPTAKQILSLNYVNVDCIYASWVSGSLTSASSLSSLGIRPRSFITCWRISSNKSAFSRRNSLAFSRPWPSLTSP